MFRTLAMAAALGAVCLLTPVLAVARDLGVEIATDRGHEAVYQPGEDLKIKVKISDDSYLLVYEIDSEGVVRVLFPLDHDNARVEGSGTLELPLPDSDLQLVVESAVGQSFIVAIASRAPFADLPWYLRTSNPQGDELGYVNTPKEEEGVTADGHIVGDPFVAMERIRRQVLGSPDDGATFATAFTSYYVEHAVRYPRYICNDCHRPETFAFWDGYDPYYTTCSVFDVRVNWAWGWGPRYWYGSVPYFVYVGRPGCPPRYLSYCAPGFWFSSWDGWNRWCSEWGTGGLRRYKSDPPVGYIPPSRYGPVDARTPATRIPPGYLATNTRRYRGASNPALPIGRNGTPRDLEGGSGDSGTRRERPPVGGRTPDTMRPGGTVAPMPAGRSDGSDGEGSAPPVRTPRPQNDPQQPPTPVTPSRQERPTPAAPPRNDPPAPTQRNDAPARTPTPAPAQRGGNGGSNNIQMTPRSAPSREVRGASQRMRDLGISWTAPRRTGEGWTNGTVGAGREDVAGGQRAYAGGGQRGYVRGGQNAYVRGDQSASSGGGQRGYIRGGTSTNSGGGQRAYAGGGQRSSAGGGQRSYGGGGAARSGGGGASGGRGGFGTRTR